MKRSTAIVDWEQLFDRMTVPDDKDRDREKAVTEHIRQHAHHISLFLFHPPICDHFDSQSNHGFTGLSIVRGHTYTYGHTPHSHTQPDITKPHKKQTLHNSIDVRRNFRCPP